MKYKKLLVLTHSYSNFTKDQIECLSPYFDQITVLVRQTVLSNAYHIIPLPALKPVLPSVKVDLQDVPSNIRVLNVPLIYLPIDLWYKRLGTQHYNEVLKIITKNKISFDLIHAHFTWSAGYVGSQLKEKYHVPFVLTTHGYDIYDLPFRDIEWQEKIKLVLSAANHVITVSQNNHRCIEMLEIKPPVSVLPNGFRKNLFTPVDMVECREKLNLPKNKKIILTIGHLVKVKGHRYLIDAMKIIVSQRNDIQCLILGSGTLKKRLEQQIEDLRLGEYVKIVNSKPHGEIPTWINACDLFTLPSLHEGLPVVNIEAMACGKPVIATRNGGSEELIADPKLGSLVEPANPEQLAKELLAALDQSWDKERITRYAQHFQWEEIAARIVQVYEGLD